MKKSKVFEQILNGLVLLGSLAIIIVASNLCRSDVSISWSGRWVK